MVSALFFNPLIIKYDNSLALLILCLLIGGGQCKLISFRSHFSLVLYGAFMMIQTGRYR
jgi:hypothetical protein